MAVFTVFFVVLAIHFGHWGLLFCYFVIGVVPAVAFCFYVIGSQQLWDVNYIADILFLSKSSMVTKLQALGPLISSVHKGHADQTDGEIDHGTQHTEETTKSLLNIINTNSNSSSSSNNNALTTTKITSTVDTTEKPTSFNSFPVVDNVPTLFPQCFPLSSSQGLTPDTPVSCSREIECEIEKYVNLITRDFVQSWYKMVCAEPDIVEEIHDKIHAIMTDLYRRVRNINRRSVFVETIIMYREQLTKFQTALATFKIQMTYGMNKTNQKQNLPSSLEDAFNLKYTQHPATKDREGSIEHIKALFEIMINCMDVFPTEFKDITSMKEMLIEILTMQVAIPLLDMLEDPVFLHESIILLLSDTPVDFTNLIPSADNQPPHPLPPETMPVSTDTKVSKMVGVCDSSLKDPTIKLNETEFDEVGLDIIGSNLQKDFHKEHLQHSNFTYQGFTIDENKIILNCISPKCTDNVFISDEKSDEESYVSSHGLPLKPYNSLYFNNENQKFYAPENGLSCKRPTLTNDSTSVLTTSDEESEESNSRRNSLEERERQRSMSAGKAADLEASLRNYCDKKLNKQLGVGTESVSHSTSCDSKMSSLQKTNSRTFDLNLDSLEPDSTDAICNGRTQKKNVNSVSEFRNSFVRSNCPLLRTSESVPRLSPTEGRYSLYRFDSYNAEIPTSPDSEMDIISDDQMVSDKKYYPTCLFQDICVVETETRKESRSNGVYTLYQIQYDALYVTESGELALKSGEVKRRFREFLNLQLRLEEKRAYKKTLKGIKGPKRWLCIPFGNMDQENVAQRKKFLDNYLKNLIKKEDICNGPELKEFLAYEGDAHIAFVRKAPEINVPRIDKAFVKTVSGVLDKLTNVLPRGLSQEKMTPTGGAVIRKDSTSSNKSNEVAKCLEDTDQLLFDFNIPNDDIWSINIASGLQNYIKSVKGHNSTDTKLPSPDLSEQVPLPSETSIKKLTSLSKSNASDTTDSSQVTTQATPDPVLSSAVHDLATQALQGCDSWVCKESSYRSIQVIFGTVLDRCLQQKLDRMTSRSQCLNYLQLLREKIWPNGKLSMQPPPQKSPAEIQATKELAHQCLKEYFPRILYFAIGEDNLNHGIVQLLAAIQYKKLNRHFIFCLVDALFLHLFPEVKNKSFQQNILRSYMKENNKSTTHSPTVEG